jgi:hypothetical protein
MHCMLCLVSHNWTFALDPAEPEPKVQSEQAQVEKLTNLSLDQSKPGAFSHAPCFYFLNLSLFEVLVVH